MRDELAPLITEDAMFGNSGIEVVALQAVGREFNSRRPLSRRLKCQGGRAFSLCSLLLEAGGLEVGPR